MKYNDNNDENQNITLTPLCILPTAHLIECTLSEENNNPVSISIS